MTFAHSRRAYVGFVPAFMAFSLGVAQMPGAAAGVPPLSASSVLLKELLADNGFLRAIGCTSDELVRVALLRSARTEQQAKLANWISRASLDPAVAVGDPTTVFSLCFAKGFFQGIEDALGKEKAEKFRGRCADAALAFEAPLAARLEVTEAQRTKFWRVCRAAALADARGEQDGNANLGTDATELAVAVLTNTQRAELHRIASDRPKERRKYWPRELINPENHSHWFDLGAREWCIERDLEEAALLRWAGFEDKDISRATANVGRLRTRQLLMVAAIAHLDDRRSALAVAYAFGERTLREDARLEAFLCEGIDRPALQKLLSYRLRQMSFGSPLSPPMRRAVGISQEQVDQVMERLKEIEKVPMMGRLAMGMELKKQGTTLLGRAVRDALTPEQNKKIIEIRSSPTPPKELLYSLGLASATRTSQAHIVPPDVIDVEEPPK